MAKSQMKVKINNPAMKKIYGDEVIIDVDENKTPLDRYWRNRVRDAVIDGCITLSGIKKSQK